MRLIVTRPMQDAAPLAEKLAAAGHDVILSPVIDIEPTGETLPVAEDYAALALTSANGVRALAAALAAAPDTAALWKAKPAYAVGPQTASALAALDWPSVKQAQGDVAALATLIAADHPQNGGAVLHIAGTHRAGDLNEALHAAGLTAGRAVLYEAVPADALTDAAEAALADADDAPDAVLLYSQRSARIFLALYGRLHAAARPHAYCLSPAISELMQAEGFAANTAATPDNAGMLALCGRADS